jgi:hypothetical protein
LLIGIAILGIITLGLTKSWWSNRKVVGAAKKAARLEVAAEDARQDIITKGNEAREARAVNNRGSETPNPAG